MEIYIEDAILQNVIINFMLLEISQKAILQKCRKLKTFFVSILGACFAVGLTFFQFSTFLTFAIKMICGILMTVIMIKNFKLKQFLLFYFVFLSSTFIMGGLCMALQNLFQNKLSGVVIVLAIFVFYIILKNLLKQFYVKKKLNNFYYKLQLILSDKKVNIKAYLDSGNLLQDKSTGCPILIIDYKTFEQLFGEKISIIDYLQNRLDKKLKGKYLNYQTVNGQSKMFVCSIDKVILKTNNNIEELNVMLGLTSNFDTSFDCQGLLSPLAFQT